MLNRGRRGEGGLEEGVLGERNIIKDLFKKSFRNLLTLGMERWLSVLEHLLLLQRNQI